MIKVEQKGEPYLPHGGMIKLDEYKPTGPTNFMVIVEVGIAQFGKDGSDNYTVNVCTPQWLSEDLKRNGKPLFVKGILLVECYQSKVIKERIAEIISLTTGKDWDDYNRNITKDFNWEFED